MYLQVKLSVAHHDIKLPHKLRKLYGCIIYLYSLNIQPEILAFQSLCFISVTKVVGKTEYKMIVSILCNDRFLINKQKKDLFVFYCTQNFVNHNSHTKTISSVYSQSMYMYLCLGVERKANMKGTSHLLYQLFPNAILQELFGINLYKLNITRYIST